MLKWPLTMLPGVVLFACLGLAVLPVTEVYAGQSKALSQQQKGLTAKVAAGRAKARYGGKVLKVTRKGVAFQVRLLQDSGRIITVTIKE